MFFDVSGFIVSVMLPDVLLGSPSQCSEPSYTAETPLHVSAVFHETVTCVSVLEDTHAEHDEKYRGILVSPIEPEPLIVPIHCPLHVMLREAEALKPIDFEPSAL